MGGGRAMATAAKVAGIGVAKGSFRGGSGFQPASEQFRVKSSAVASASAASKPASASISSVAHPSVEEDAMIMQRPVWDDWEFAEEEPIPRVVFGKPPSLQEAKEATEDLKEAIDMVYNKSSSKLSPAIEGSKEGGSVSRMLSSFQSSENRVVESAVPQVALQAFAFLSENTAAQTVVASIASDPKVWNAVMENKDLRKFMDTKNTDASRDDDDQSENSSMSGSEIVEEKPNEILEILQDMKLKAVRVIENISSYFGSLFGIGSAPEDEKDKKQTFFNDPRSLFALAVAVIFMVVLKRA